MRRNQEILKRTEIEIEILRLQEKMVAPYIENRIKRMFRARKINHKKTSFLNYLYSFLKNRK
jgi:hypothetical protein